MCQYNISLSQDLVNQSTCCLNVDVYEIWNVFIFTSVYLLINTIIHVGFGLLFTRFHLHWYRKKIFDFST